MSTAVARTTNTPDETPQDVEWYRLEAEAVAAKLDVEPDRGLSSAAVEQRLAEYGPNRLSEKQKEPGWQAFLRQYQDLMQIVLVSAAIVNQIVTGETGTTLVLIGLTLFNAILALNQESKAEAALASLQEMLKTIARVRRDGEVLEIEADQIVPGDVILVEAGNVIPADGRLLLAATLEIEEAALTGESVPALKDVSRIDKPEVPLGDRLCMAYMNTSVTRGRAEADRHRHGHAHGDRQDRRHAQPDGGREDTASEEAGRAYPDLRRSSAASPSSPSSSWASSAANR